MQLLTTTFVCTIIHEDSTSQNRRRRYIGNNPTFIYSVIGVCIVGYHALCYFELDDWLVAGLTALCL